MKFWILPFYAVIVDEVLTKIKEPYLYIYYRDPINDTFVEYKKSNTGEYCVGSIGFYVHDISPEKIYDKSRNWILFSENDAKKLVEFVKKNMNRVKLIVCQCMGGVSRSSATAAALDECINKTKRSSIWDDGRYVPNRLIYNSLKNKWNEGKITTTDEDSEGFKIQYKEYLI